MKFIFIVTVILLCFLSVLGKKLKHTKPQLDPEQREDHKQENIHPIRMDNNRNHFPEFLGKKASEAEQGIKAVRPDLQVVTTNMVN